MSSRSTTRKVLECVGSIKAALINALILKKTNSNRSFSNILSMSVGCSSYFLLKVQWFPVCIIPTILKNGECESRVSEKKVLALLMVLDAGFNYLAGKIFTVNISILGIKMVV